MMINHIICFFIIFYSGRRRFFHSEYRHKLEMLTNSCMYVSTQVDFRSLCLKSQETKSHKNCFVSSCEFEVIRPFQISECLTMFQGYAPGHRFIETLPYTYMYIYIYTYIYIYPIYEGEPGLGALWENSFSMGQALRYVLDSIDVMCGIWRDLVCVV